MLSDEVYSGLIFDGNEYVSCGSFAEYSDMVIVVQSCSKNFGMTGWRVGFVFGPAHVIKTLINFQGQTITGTSVISQWAAVSALSDAKKITAEVCAEIQYRRDVFVSTFNRLFSAHISAPKSALYCLIPLAAFGTTETDDVAFCERVMEDANIAMVPGKAFGQSGYVRCAFGAPAKELEEGLIALASYLKS